MRVTHKPGQSASAKPAAHPAAMPEASADGTASAPDEGTVRPALVGVRGNIAIGAGLAVLAVNIIALVVLEFAGAGLARTHLGSALLLVALSSAGAGLGGFVAMRGVRRRLMRISDLLVQAESGNYSERIKVSRRDELGLLASQANRLCASAQHREKTMTESAMTDSLTGLPNRALLSNRLDQMIAVAKRDAGQFAVALIDLDRFKWVNDTLGHDAGDKLLLEVAARLRASVRASDTVARLGGDEFVLLIQGGLTESRTVADHLLEAMKKPVRLQGQKVDVSMSIGIAVFPEHGDTALTLMRHADSAMYDAKRKRSGRAEHTKIAKPVDAGRERESLSMLGEMRAALQRGEFMLMYQPKLDLNTGLIRSVEGLIRWKHPQRGMVPPGQFIPLAEQSGFMRELTLWVVNEGAVFANHLREIEMDVRVAVNVSTMDLEDTSFAKRVANIVKALDLEAGRLGLEITETGMLSETEQAISNLHRISALGVKLSVDDFGTGYSSLAQLQKLKVDELKIDRSFVHGMTTNRGNATIVNSTIEMGRQLGLNVVAEGVENAAEMRALAAMGCDEIQGFFLAKPMPGSDLIDWIRSRHALHEHSQDEYFKMLLAG